MPKAVDASGTEVSRGQIALLGKGDEVAFTAASDARALVVAGRPLNEPVARYGPFVMNTRDELLEAIEDFQAGRMGNIAASGSL